MPLQHNPHSHSIVCAALGVTLDGFETRESPVEIAGCPGCQCVQMPTGENAPADEPAPAPSAEPAE